MIKLTSRQKSVLKQVAKGNSPKQIALSLKVTESRVNAIIGTLYRMAGIQGGKLVKLYNWALVNKLVKAPRGSLVEGIENEQKRLSETCIESGGNPIHTESAVQLPIHNCS